MSPAEVLEVRAELIMIDVVRVRSPSLVIVREVPWFLSSLRNDIMTPENAVSLGVKEGVRHRPPVLVVLGVLAERPHFRDPRVFFAVLAMNGTE